MARIPKAVQRQADAADAAAQELLAQQAALNPAPLPDAPVAAPEAQIVTDLPPGPAPTPEPAGEDWEARFKGLKRTHDDTVSAQRNQIAALDAQLAQVNTSIEELRRKPVAPVETTAPSVSAVDVLSALTDEQRQTYDASFIDVVMRVTQQVLQSQNAQVAEQIGHVARRIDGVEHVVTESREDKFWNHMRSPDKGVPNFVEVNAMPLFQEWAMQIEPITGTVRNDIIKASQQALNPGPIVALYRQFLNEQRAIAPPEPVVPPVDPREKLLTPTSSGSGTQGQPRAPTLRQSFIESFTADVTKGRYRGREAEAARIQKEIDAAYQAGTVIAGA